MFGDPVRRVAAGGIWLLALAAGCGAGAGVGGDSGGGEGQRYLVDATFRRARLVASLVNPANEYSKLRLLHYATGAARDGAGDWDHLPVWNPAVAPVFPGGAAVGALVPLTVTGDAAQLRSLGEAAFFRYPAQLASFVLPALAKPQSINRYGLWSDAAHGAGGVVSVQFSDGTYGAAITCSTCHARMEGGALVAGLPNQQLDLGALMSASGGGSDWGPGRIDVAPPPGEEPIAIPDLRPVAFLTNLHRDGTVENNLIALAIRIETLIITSHGGVIRAPREVSLGLAVYLWSLAPPPIMKTPDPGSSAGRGAALFELRCAHCHAPPGFSGPPVSLDVAGTDPRVGLSRDRGTGGYRVPSLRGIKARGRLLHDNSAPDLDTLFDPGRLQASSPIVGHRFGLDLSLSERADLLSYLRTL